MARLGLLVFMIFSLASAWFHIEIAYLLDVWGISGKTPAIAADKFTAVDRSGWKVHDVSSFETVKDEGLPKNAWDGDPKTFWHTEWQKKKPKHPHHLAIDLGRSSMIYAVEYLPRQEGVNGKIKGYVIKVSEDGTKWKDVANGDFLDGKEAQLVRLSRPSTGRFIRIDCTSEMQGGIWACIAELQVLTIE